MIIRANILFVRATLKSGAHVISSERQTRCGWKQSLDARRRGRSAGPAPEGMIERRASLIAQQPGHLRKRYARSLDVLQGEAPPQLVDNVLEGCALAGQFPRQRSRAHRLVFSQHCAFAPCRAAATFAPRFRPQRVSSPAPFRAAWPPRRKWVEGCPASARLR